MAIIKGHESYELLQRSCSSIFGQVNKLIEGKRITINGTSIPVEVYLGGDYKVNRSTMLLKYKGFFPVLSLVCPLHPLWPRLEGVHPTSSPQANPSLTLCFDSNFLVPSAGTWDEVSDF